MPDRIELQKREIDYKSLKNYAGKESDCSVVSPSSEYDGYCDGKKVLTVRRFSEAVVNNLRYAVTTIKYGGNKRTGGIKSDCATFGYHPRNVIMNNFCRTANLSSKYPYEHNIFCNYGKLVESFYKEHYPEVHSRHKAEVEKKISPDWRLDDSIFTSGIINKSTELKYHRDAGNVKSGYSVMIVLRKNTKGGSLLIPEYDLRIKCEDRSVIIFDNPNLAHAVSPIYGKSAQGSYRYSMIWYSLEQLWKCLPVGEELERARLARQDVERRRANYDPGLHPDPEKI